MTTSEKYWWVLGHPKFINKDMVSARIEIEPHDICPETNRIEDFKALNTKTQLWVELMVPMYVEEDREWVQAHDYELDCGGDTYDEAIDNLYNNVLEHYGDYTDKEADDVFNATHKPPSMLGFMSAISQPYESRNKWASCVIDEVEAKNLKDDVENLKNTIKVLRTYLKSCTIEQEKEAKIHLESEECKLWVLEKSLEKGIDLDI